MAILSSICSSTSVSTTAAVVLLRLLLLLHHQTPTSAGPVATEFLYPNFTASNFLYVDSTGVFLASRNAAFNAAVYNPGGQQSNFYLALIHVPTNIIVWTANRGSPVSNSGTVVLSAAGLSVSRYDGTLAWSTPALRSPVSALRLLDSGNLLLLDAANASLWQSFDHPTDTLISGQTLPAGSFLSSAASNIDLSDGGYQFLVTPGDAVMRWTGSQQYWSLSTEPSSVKDSNAVVSYMATNATGLYLFSSDGEPVFQLILPRSNFRIMKLESGGRFRIVNYYNESSTSSLLDEFVAPSSDCDLPYTCYTLGLCTAGSMGSTCICPNLLRPSKSQSGGCSPADGSVLASSSSCSSGGSSISYLSLGSTIDYFAMKFAAPIASGDDISACRSLCTANCSCLGFFYLNLSRSCYLLKDQLGSLLSTSSGDAGNDFGYIKTVVSGSLPQTDSKGPSATSLIAILLPSIAAFLLVIVLFFVGSLWRRRMKRERAGSKSLAMKGIQMGRQKTWAIPADGEGSDDDEILIPGLPTRFSYEELESATNNFRTKIGSGGFGAVYKGALPDKTEVAVKRIDSVGVQGRREFCTEIAVIGNIHHVNLVRLRGFCAEGSVRLLVYEYMNRSSLDRSLFGPGPVLEWQERVEIAISSAKGLAYLHSGCDHRIIHCDIKPENILLHDGGQVKIADFGLAKLLSSEQSGFFTTMRGTRGYLAPEWLTNSAISDKTDVYSYGMVLLEIVRGRKNRSSESEAETGSAWSGSDSGSARPGGGYFPTVALEMHERGRYVELADPRLEGRVAAAEVERVVRVALCCLHEEPGLRPSMAAVAGMLEGTMEAWEPRIESLNFLRIYGRGFPAAGNGLLQYGGNLTESVTSSTSGSLSYLSSQQVSGPR